MIPARKSLRFAISLVILACISIGQSAQTSSPPSQREMGSRKHYAGLPNFAQVSPNLFRGGQPGADGLEALKKMGVSIVVDMRSSKSSHEQNVVTKLGMQYVPIPWHCPFPTDKIFAAFLKVIQDNPGKKIFVHCRLGDDRTGMAIAAYRMADEGWSAADAFQEMKTFGFSKGHYAICPPLLLYERDFPNRLKESPAFKDLQLPAATK